MKEFWTVLSAVVPAMVALGVFLSWVVRTTVRDEVAKINGTYVRANGSTVTGAEIERRLEHIESRCEARHGA